MRNLKSVVAFVIVLAMVCGLTGFANYSDIPAEASYAEAVTMLSFLNILNGYDDGSFKPDGTITRAEVAKVLVCALGQQDSANGLKSAQVFTDVPESHWAAGFVNFAAQVGIINGMGDGTFAPDAPVKYEQAVKMIVCMLGYDYFAINRGGYPNGYLAVAASSMRANNKAFNLTKGATGAVGEDAKRAIVARLVFNALEVYKTSVQYDAWGNRVAIIPKNEDSDDYNGTLLEDLEIDKVEGVIVETYLSEGSVVEDDNKTITVDVEYLNGKKLSSIAKKEIAIGETNAVTLIGNRVIGYVKNYDDSDRELIAIAPASDKNVETIIGFNEIEKATANLDSKTSYQVLKYYKDGDFGGTASKLNISKSATMIVNNTIVDDDLDIGAYLMDNYSSNLGKDGNIRAIDNDNDGTYDVIAVTVTYGKDLVVKDVTARTHRVTSENNVPAVTLDPTDDDQEITFIKDGKVVDFAAIEAGNILSFVTNVDGNKYLPKSVNNATFITVYISTNSFDGTAISRTSKVVGGKTIYKYKCSDGNTYELMASEDGSTIKLNENGTFYVNVFNKLVYQTASEGHGTLEGDLAFLYSATAEADAFSGDYIKVRVLLADGTWASLNFASKTTLGYYNGDGELTTATKSVSDLLKADTLKTLSGGVMIKGNDKNVSINNGDTKPEKRIVKIVHTSSEVKKIYFASNASNLDEDALGYEEHKNLEYDAEDMTFGGSKGGQVDENTVVFMVKPNEDGDIAYNDTTNFGVKSAVNAFKDTREYSFFGYEKNADSGVYSAIVMRDDLKVDPASKFIVINEVIWTTNDDGDDVAVINGMFEGQESVNFECSYDYTATEKTLINNLKAGDVIVVEYDMNSKVNDLEVIMTVAKVKAYAQTAGAGKDIANPITGLDADDLEYLGYAYKYSSANTRLYLSKAPLEDPDKTPGYETINVSGSKYVGATYFVNAKSSSRVTVSVGDATSISVNNAIVDDGEVSGEGYYVFTRVVDGETKDIVVYEIAESDIEYIPTAE